MKFRLKSPHYFPGDRYVESGVVVGDGTPYDINFTDPKAPGYYPPTSEMEGLDKPSEAAAAKAPDINGAIDGLPIDNGNAATLTGTPGV